MSDEGIRIPTLEDDGLPTPEVGDWAEDKYRLLKLYATLFTTAMRGKWDALFYLDLFAGAGRSRIRGSDRIVPASPSLALGLEHPFDRYVFCEAKAPLLEALRERVTREFPEVNARFVVGDVNRNGTEILAQLPQPRPERRVLGFSLVDPFSLKNLRFRTISELAEARYMDFLVLIPTGYDATRNEDIYLDKRNRTIDTFLGSRGWRNEWEDAKGRRETFDRFMTDAFGRSMEELGYIYEGVESTQLIRSTEKNVRLYRLAFFSRHPLGAKFWNEVKKYAPDQRSFDFS